MARTRTKRTIEWKAYLQWNTVLLALIFLLALGLRILFVRHFQTPWLSDEASQRKYVIAFASGQYFCCKDAYWPPGWIVVAGILLKVLGSLRAVIYFETLMGALTVLFVEAIARRFFGKIAGLIAAFLYAIYVPFIYYSGTFFSETTFFFFTLGAVAMLARALDTNKKRDLIFAGILFGCSAMSRPVSLPLPVLAFFLFWFQKNGLPGWTKLFNAVKKTILLLVITFLTIMPWTIRNWIVLGHPVLIDVNGGINMYIAHNPTSQGIWYMLPKSDPILQLQHFPEGEKMGNAAAMNYIKTHPQQTIDQFWKVNDMFWNKGDFDVDNKKQGGIVDLVLKRFHLPSLRFLDIKWWALYAAIIPLLLRWRKAIYLGLFIISYNIVIDLIYFAPRYRMVIEPFLMILLAGGIGVILDGIIGIIRKEIRNRKGNNAVPPVETEPQT